MRRICSENVRVVHARMYVYPSHILAIACITQADTYTHAHTDSNKLAQALIRLCQSLCVLDVEGVCLSALNICRMCVVCCISKFVHVRLVHGPPPSPPYNVNATARS